MIFKQLLFSAAVVSALALSSCSQEDGTQSNATEQAEDDAILTNISPASPGASAAQSATVLSSSAGQQQSVTKGSAQTAKTVAAVNPPHGQPGHDCAVAVGAPLNAIAGDNTPQAQPAVTSPAAASVPAAKGSGRMNPAHGQPGHDCAVAVGAPLP